jgi:hypothetical protein
VLLLLPLPSCAPSLLLRWLLHLAALLLLLLLLRARPSLLLLLPVAGSCSILRANCSTNDSRRRRRAREHRLLVPARVARHPAAVVDERVGPRARLFLEIGMVQRCFC